MCLAEMPVNRGFFEIIICFYRKTRNILARKDENKTDGTVNGIESGIANFSLNKNEQAVYGLLGKNLYYTRQELTDATSKSLRMIQHTLLSATGCFEKRWRTCCIFTREYGIIKNVRTSFAFS